MRILIVEDDQTIASNLKKILETQHYIVKIEFTAEDGNFTGQSEEFDLIVLDWMLPDGSGIEIVKNLRGKNIKTPCLMLTAKSQVEDVVAGFEAGADDYIIKPFTKEILLARIKSLLRRRITPLVSPQLKIGYLHIDTEKRTVTYLKKQIHLAPKEYMLLEYLVLHKNTSIDRMKLLEEVWGETVDDLSNTVDVHIRYLRRKIDEVYKINLIQTVKNKGYMICDT